MTDQQHFDVIVIGGGQSGLATGFFLRRTGLKYIILDEQERPGGAWLQTWDSLKLFSPAEHSSLPGWMMPKDVEEYPGKNHVIQYLSDYEMRYNLPVERPVIVNSVSKTNQTFVLDTSKGMYTCSALISATGTWKNPFIPEYAGRDLFEGIQLHSSQYRNEHELINKKVLIIGGGNSGAQILAEVSKVADTTWVTQEDPKFLSDDVDGRYLFEFASKQYKAQREGREIKSVGSLGDVVMVESVKEARNRDVLKTVRPFTSFYKNGVIWPDGSKEAFDAVIWCTGFKSSLGHLAELGITQNGRIATQDTKATAIEGLWLVGYGSCTGYASATLIGVGRTARQTVREVQDWIGEQPL
ncbi:NAD(P)-binding domain-containing protein [Fulvivirga sp. 29W222]|uniref:NAD(P)-binding domain-containing protein n=2 Tax=Fulvivirga marina TaxID=2494733 RepID=A0A937KFD6_9BACT|nr:NAD(P)-binding domain-containing protein [Fulvivirga marina]